MALVIPTNVSVKIYRTANPAAPYTLGALSATVKGVIYPKAHAGRFGSATWLKWTHLILLQPTTDIRDAYNSQLDPARDNTIADTVIILDLTTPTTKTAYYVVFVERIGKGVRGDHIRAYLDRFQPNVWPTDSI
jgi:hypothetical protein